MLRCTLPFLPLSLLVLACGRAPADSQTDPQQADPSDLSTPATPATPTPRVQAEQLNLPVPPTDKAWGWRSVVDPAAVPSVADHWDRALDGVDLTADLLVRANGRAIYKSELDAWLWLTRGQIIARAVQDVALAHSLCERMGLAPPDELPPEELLALAPAVLGPVMPTGVDPGTRDRLLAAQFGDARLGLEFIQRRLEQLRLLFPPEWELDRVPTYLQPLLAQIPEEDLKRQVAALYGGEADAMTLNFLQRAAAGLMEVERITRAYNFLDHPEAADFVVAIVPEAPVVIDEIPVPWELRGDTRYWTVADLEAELPGWSWSEADRLSGLRELVAYRLMEGALQSSDAWPADADRWRDFWTAANREIASGLGVISAMNLVHGYDQFAEMRWIHEIRTYAKAGLVEELRDDARMAAFHKAMGWATEQYVFTVGALPVAFYDPATGRSAGAEAEAAAYVEANAWKTRLEAGHLQFETAAYQAIRELPGLPDTAPSEVRIWLDTLQKNYGILTGQRLALQNDLFHEWTRDILIRGASLADNAVSHLAPGEIAGPWKGTHCWWVVRLYSGRPTHPSRAWDEVASLGMVYRDERFLRWVAGVFGSATISLP